MRNRNFFDLMKNTYKIPIVASYLALKYRKHFPWLRKQSTDDLSYYFYLIPQGSSQPKQWGTNKKWKLSSMEKKK